MSTERQMSIPNDLVPRKVNPASGRSAPQEPLWSRPYVQWLATALVLVALLAAAVAALEIVTARPRRQAAAPIPARHEQRVDEVESDVELIGVPR